MSPVPSAKKNLPAQAELSRHRNCLIATHLLDYPMFTRLAVSSLPAVLSTVAAALFILCSFTMHSVVEFDRAKHAEDAQRAQVEASILLGTCRSED